VEHKDFYTAISVRLTNSSSEIVLITGYSAKETEHTVRLLSYLEISGPYVIATVIYTVTLITKPTFLITKDMFGIYSCLQLTFGPLNQFKPTVSDIFLL